MNASASHLVKATVALGIIASVVAACGSSKPSSSSSKGFKVAVLTPGTETDGSWGQAVSEGAKEYGAKYGATVRVATNLEAPSEYEQQATAFADQGYNLIIDADASTPAVLEKVAKQYPNVKFGQVATGLEHLAPNTQGAAMDLASGQFITGYAAGLLNTTGTVGDIGGFEFPALNTEMEGFALGAKFAKPNIKVLRTYIDTWTDVGKAQAAAEADAAKGAETIFSATDQATEGIYAAAQKSSTLKYVIAQYFNKADLAPSIVLTSVLFNLQGVVGQYIQQYAEHKWKSTNRFFGLTYGVGKLAPNPQVWSKLPSEVRTKVEAVTKKIEEGTIKVPLTTLAKAGGAESVNLKSLETS